MNALVYLLFRVYVSDEAWFLLLLGSDILSLLTLPSVLFQRKGRPLSAVSWTLAIFALPYLGVVAWWLFGREHLKRRRRKRENFSKVFQSCLSKKQQQDTDAHALFEGILPDPKRFPYENADLFPPTTENQVEVLVDGERAFPAMEAAIQGAKRYIHLFYYIWQADSTGTRWRDLLAQKAKEGVEVRILVDAIGSPRFGKHFTKALRKAGAEVSTFLPLRFRKWIPALNFRNHRKVMIIDGEVAYTGGMNITYENEALWHDFVLELQGPVVTQLHEIFLDDWYYATKKNLALTGYLPQKLTSDTPTAIEDDHAEGMPKTDLTEHTASETQGVILPAVSSVCCAIIASGPDGKTNWSHDTFFLALSSARKRIYLTTPYFIPSKPIMAALRAAAQRGCDVRLLLPYDSDVPLVRLASRTYYASLLEMGVRIYEYKEKILHAKTLVIDDQLSILGTANVDTRSFQLNFEIGCFFMSSTLNKQLTEIFESDLQKSVEIDVVEFEKASWAHSIRESLAHLLSPLL